MEESKGNWNNSPRKLRARKPKMSTTIIRPTRKTVPKNTSSIIALTTNKISTKSLSKFQCDPSLATRSDGIQKQIDEKMITFTRYDEENESSDEITLRNMSLGISKHKINHNIRKISCTIANSLLKNKSVRFADLKSSKTRINGKRKLSDKMKLTLNENRPKSKDSLAATASYNYTSTTFGSILKKTIVLEEDISAIEGPDDGQIFMGNSETPKQVPENDDEKFNNKLDNNSRLNKHQRRRCSHCSKVLSSSYYKVHKKIHYRVDDLARIECETCQKKFLSKSILKIHQENIHDKIRNFNCECCGKGYYRRVDKNLHISATHENVRFVCGDCKKKYRYQSSLSTHIKNIHEDNNPYPCNICEDKSFPYKSTLAQHMKSHAIDKNCKRVYKHPRKRCSTCFVEFSTTYIAKHKQIHTTFLSETAKIIPSTSQAAAVSLKLNKTSNISQKNQKTSVIPQSKPKQNLTELNTINQKSVNLCRILRSTKFLPGEIDNGISKTLLQSSSVKKIIEKVTRPQHRCSDCGKQIAINYIGRHKKRMHKMTASMAVATGGNEMTVLSPITVVLQTEKENSQVADQTFVVATEIDTLRVKPVEESKPNTVTSDETKNVNNKDQDLDSIERLGHSSFVFADKPKQKKLASKEDIEESIGQAQIIEMQRLKSKCKFKSQSINSRDKLTDKLIKTKIGTGQEETKGKNMAKVNKSIGSLKSGTSKKLDVKRLQKPEFSLHLTSHTSMERNRSFSNVNTHRHENCKIHDNKVSIMNFRPSQTNQTSGTVNIETKKPIRAPGRSKTSVLVSAMNPTKKIDHPQETSSKSRKIQTMNNSNIPIVKPFDHRTLIELIHPTKIFRRPEIPKKTTKPKSVSCNVRISPKKLELILPHNDTITVTDSEVINHPPEQCFTTITPIPKPRTKFMKPSYPKVRTKLMNPPNPKPRPDKFVTITTKTIPAQASLISGSHESTNDFAATDTSWNPCMTLPFPPIPKPRKAILATKRTNPPLNESTSDLCMRSYSERFVKGPEKNPKEYRISLSPPGVYCDICKAVVPTNEINVHRIMEHSSKSVFDCRYCSHKFKSFNEVKEHDAKCKNKPNLNVVTEFIGRVDSCRLSQVCRDIGG